MGVGTAGTLEEVTEYADLAAGVQRSWGRRTEFEDIPPGVFSFVLDNSDGRFTPGNTASPLTTTVTEGMAVCWNAGLRGLSALAKTGPASTGSVSQMTAVAHRPKFLLAEVIVLRFAHFRLGSLVM